MSALTDILSPQKRKVMYAIYSAIGLCLAAAQAVYGALDTTSPDWLKAALAVYAVVGTGIGATAASNVKSAPIIDAPAGGGPARG